MVPRHRAVTVPIDLFQVATRKRVGATGDSAGACTALWLALHDDLADPRSSDPIARQSSRLTCAAVNGVQTSLDPQELRAWMPNAIYGLKLKEKLDPLGVETVVSYPGHLDTKYGSITRFLIAKLTGE